MFNAPAAAEIYSLSLHDALPISKLMPSASACTTPATQIWLTILVSCPDPGPRSEEHTSELQSHSDLVCRLLLEKKKNSGFARDERRTCPARAAPCPA